MATATVTPTHTATSIPGPIVAMSVNPVGGPIGTKVDFTVQAMARNIGSGGFIKYYGWNFEANEIPAERTDETRGTFMLKESWTYNEPGVFEASFFAWDDRDIIGSSSKTITIWTPVPTPSETPTPSLTSTPTLTLTPTSTPVPPIGPPDLNHDGRVNEKDVLIFINSDDPESEHYDLTGDGQRDSLDVFLFVVYWGWREQTEPPKGLNER
jgi:hypothetical protein